MRVAREKNSRVAQLQELSNRLFVSPYHVAVIYADLGENGNCDVEFLYLAHYSDIARLFAGQ